jgi:hypothetical protein
MHTLTGGAAPAGATPSFTELRDAPGLWLDALLPDADGELLFLSAWGRDTAAQELVARLSLSEREGGLERLWASGLGRYVEVGNPDRLEKHTGRVRTSLYGELTHLWVYHRLAVRPDRANRKALLLHRPVRPSDDEGREALRERLWALVRETCHLPLLAHWRERVLNAFEGQDWVRPLEGLGMDAVLVDLGEPRLEDVIHHLAARGEIPIEEEALALVLVEGASPVAANETDAAKEETPMQQQLDDPVFGPVIYSYTRAQAIADGVLVDVSEIAKEAGFRWAVALTAAAWSDCVEWTEEDSRRQTHQDASGRLWDVLWMAGQALRGATENAEELLFELLRLPRDGKSTEAVPTRLKLMSGPGDDGEPVLTVLLPEED